MVRQHCLLRIDRSVALPFHPPYGVRAAASRVGLLCLCVLSLTAVLGSGAAAAGADPACPNEAIRAEQRSTGLPDCRAYEMVSPPDKNGGGVMMDASRIRAAETEAPGLPLAAMFPSLSAFADAVGTGNAVDYLAQRTLAPNTQGWSTHAVTPPQESMTFGENGFTAADPFYAGEASPDLTRAVFKSYSPLTAAPNVAALRNLYLRSDLRAPGAGSYTLLTDASTPQSFGSDASTGELAKANPNLVAASSGLGTALFESTRTWGPDAPANDYPKLYLSNGGLPRYVGLVPPGAASSCTGSSCQPAASSITGEFPLATYRPHVISSDGSRVLFMVPFTPAEPRVDSGALYLRDYHGTASTADDTTVEVSASELAAPEAPLPATRPYASTHASRIFFISAERLTADAPADSSAKLYMWSLAPDAEGHHLTLLSADLNPADPPRGVVGTIGASDDGSVVYFVQGGQIVAGEEALGDGLGIYAWRQGNGVSYLGRIRDTSDGETVIQSGGDYSLGNVLQSSVTRDGRHLLVALRQPPQATGGFDHGDCHENGLPIDGKVGCREIYRWDLADPANPVCVSCSPDGEPPFEASASFRDRYRTGNASQTYHLNHPISADGSRVFFTTPVSLLSSDANGVADAYEWEAPGAGSCTGSSAAFSAPNGGCLYLLSAGTGAAPSFFAEATPDGHDAFIITGQRLSGWDSDDGQDLYDVRVGGGVPEPAPSAAPPCQGESCQPAAPTPGAGAAASGAFRGPGNLGVRSDCRAPTRRASRLSHRAKRLRRHAGSARRKGKRALARSRAHRARHLAARARKLSADARRCRRGGASERPDSGSSARRARTKHAGHANRRAGK